MLLFSQNWRDDFYSTSNDTKSATNFYEIQKNFNEFWSKYNVKGGYYLVDGKKKKAAGWKQFKRWEWFWETRVDAKTGAFPSFDKMLLHEEIRSMGYKSDESNWVSMGPNSSDGGYAGIGRINCIAFHPTNKNIFWVGAPSGGLWKTTDGGSSWTVLTDELPVIGVSEIFIPSDYETSKTIYIATGDRDGGDNYSIGVLKSTDEGQTWQATGLTFNVSSRYRITRMLVHPTQQNIMYVSTNGGIFKTSNSGANWTSIQSGVFFDMEFQYGGEDTVLYAVTAYSNGISPKFYKTKNAGASWTEVYSFSNTYRVEIDVAQSNPDIVYVLTSTLDGGMEGIYKSTNRGDAFAKIYDGTVSGNNLLNWYAGDSDVRGQGWYDLTLSVSPTDENTLYLGGINSWKSTDGGVNWNLVSHWHSGQGVQAVHADKHYMEFQDNSTFFEANDGGLYKTTDAGTSWVDLTDGMVISQIYKLGVSQTVKDEVITGLQDNGSKLKHNGTTWYDVKGGDGMECLIDYTDVNVQYATYTNGQIDRTLNRWNTSKDITSTIGDEGAWVTPYVIDPTNSQTLYLGYSDVWKTTNRGDSWTKISSLSLSNKIRSMAIAPSNNKTLYITDFNTFYRTTNGGISWTNLTTYLPLQPAENYSVTSITVDAFNSQKLWITYSGYNSYKVYESTNGGQNWTNISAGLPSVPANTIVQNKMSVTQHLYVGTDVGVYVKKGTENWTLFSNNLPSVIVSELEIYYDATPANSVLYAATYGRGLWKSNLASFTVGIESEGIDNSDFRFYPNPSNGSVSVKFLKNYKVANVTVMDMLGKVVHKEQILGTNEKPINLSHLAKSVYLVKMNIDGKDIISKLVIE